MDNPKDSSPRPGLIGPALLAALSLASMAPWACADAPYDRRTPIVEAFDKAKDAVVTITGKQLARNEAFYWDLEDWFFTPRQPRERPFLGSGFIIDSRGYVVTNAHVVEQAGEIVVGSNDGTSYQAQPVVISPTSDVALLKIKADKPLPTVTLGRSDDLMIGETVLAIGNPFGYQHTLTDGIISAQHRDLEAGDVNFDNLLQISAPINPGNSGGPLLNIHGDVIGMKTAIRRAAQNIGFAIPIDNVRQRLARALQNQLEDVRRINLGLEVSEITLEKHVPDKHAATGATSAFFDDHAVRLEVTRVRAASGAARARLQIGDIILAVNGESVHSAIEFNLLLLEQPNGASVDIEVIRPHGDKSDASTRRVRLVLKQRPKPDGRRLIRDLLGLQVTALTSQSAGQYGRLVQPDNVVVLAIEQSAPADDAGLARGDVLLGVNGQPVENIDRLGLVLEKTKPGDAVVLTCLRLRQTFWGVQRVTFEATLKARRPALPGGDAI